MKKLLFIFAFTTISIVSFSQFTYKIKADSVRLYNDTCNAELIIENATRNVDGFLYNKGNGRTEFRKPMVKVNDSIYLFGGDTLRLNGEGSSSGNYILNQYSQKQTAKAWIDTFRARFVYIPDSVNKTISRYSETGISIVGAIKDSDTSSATFSKTGSEWNKMNPPLIDLSTPFSRNSYDIWGSSLLRATRQWHMDTSYQAWWGAPNEVSRTDAVASINNNIWLKGYAHVPTYRLHSDPWRGQTFRVTTNFGKTGESGGSWKLQYAYEPLQNILSYIDFNNGSTVNFDFDPALYAARIQLNRPDTFRSIRYYTITPPVAYGSRTPGTGARYQVGYQVPDMASWDIADNNYAFQALGPNDSNYFAGPTRFPFLGNGTSDQYLGVDSKGVLKTLVSGGGSSGTINSGASGNLTYYPNSGTTVDDAGGLTWSDGADKTLSLINTGGSSIISLDATLSNGTPAILFSDAGVPVGSLSYGGLSQLTLNSGISSLRLQSDNGILLDGGMTYLWGNTYTSNITIPLTESSFRLGELANNAVMTFPGLTSSPWPGREFDIYVSNTSSTFSWTTNIPYYLSDGTTSSTLANGHFYTFRSEGFRWIAKNKSGSSGGSSGTVTSVGLTTPSWLTVSGSPITTSGTLAVTTSTGQTANQFLATPDGTTGAVGLRSIVAADIPNLDASKITTGTMATARLGSGTADNTTYLGGDQAYHSAIMSKGISIASPTTSENIMLFFTPVALTITNVQEALAGASPSVTYAINYGSSRSSATSTIVASHAASSTSGTGATLNQTSIPANSYIWLTTSATGGTVNDFHITINFRQ